MTKAKHKLRMTNHPLLPVPMIGVWWKEAREAVKKKKLWTKLLETPRMSMTKETTSCWKHWP
jgi:hypothetical protein